MNTPGIGELQTRSLTELNTYHNNPKHGDIEAIATSLTINGMYRPVVVNKGTYTNRPMEILAGNHTIKALRLLAERNPDNKQWQQADVYLIDVDDDRATRIVLADNRTADLGTYDNDTLLELLGSLDDDLGLEGTGYDDEYVNALLGGNEIEELPEGGDADTTADPISYAIVVECDTEEQQSRLLEKFIQEGLECRAIM